MEAKNLLNIIDEIVNHFDIKDVVAQISAAVGVHTGPEVFGVAVGKY